MGEETEEADATGTMRELALSVATLESSSKKETESCSTSQCSSFGRPTQQVAQPASAPQIKIDDDGNIVIDENSLAVRQDDMTEFSTMPLTSSTSLVLNATTYRKKDSCKSKPWTSKETKLFYQVLGYVGTDFQLMMQYFTGRSRVDLKRKYMAENRIRKKHLDIALASSKRKSGSSIPLPDELKSFDEPDSAEESTPSSVKKDNPKRKGK